MVEVQSMMNVTNRVLAAVLVVLVGDFHLGEVLPLRPGEISQLAAVVTAARLLQANPSTTASEKPPVTPDATVRTDILPERL